MRAKVAVCQPERASGFRGAAVEAQQGQDGGGGLEEVAGEVRGPLPVWRSGPMEVFVAG